MILPSSRHLLRAAFVRAAGRARRRGSPVLACVTLPVTTLPDIDLFARWHDIHQDAFYWRTRTPALTVCGYGRAAALTASGECRFAQLADRWRALCHDAVVQGGSLFAPFAIGGCRFDSRAAVAPHWAGFCCADLGLPERVLASDGHTHSLIVQRLLAPSSDADTEVETCMTPPEPASEPPCPPVMPEALRSVELLPGRWQDKVRAALDAIEDGHFSKVVLAREACQRHDGRIPVAVLLRRLADAAGDAHIFAFMRNGACFMGATPERLVRIDARRLQTHALAGSTGRDAASTADRALGQALMNSAKDRHEHELVVRAIAEGLRPLVTDLHVPPVPEVKRLPSIQHLCTPIAGRLREGSDIFDVLAALHPTPAVAGLPRPAAMRHILANEGFDRGWYAAPVGWIDGNGNGDFLVALRSALVRQENCHMYAGCGIVAGSDPAAEYQETCLKLSQMRKALGRSRCSPGAAVIDASDASGT